MGMSLVGNSNLPAIVATRYAANSARAVQKTNPANSLNGNMRRRQHTQDKRFDQSPARGSSRSGTDSRVSIWHNPSPSWPCATFAAQLLGQAMPDFSNAPSDLLAAYQNECSQPRLCDRRL
jgi:hypothetical protein